MLPTSWFASRWLIGKFEVQHRLTLGLVMGGFALALLIAGEVGVSVFGYGRTITEHIASYRSIASLLGMVGQFAFAIFPAVHLTMRLPVNR